MADKDKQVKIGKAKGRPMLTWVGKKPLTSVRAYPAQHIESFSVEPTVEKSGDDKDRWYDWPDKYPKGGLLFHGDNKETLSVVLNDVFSPSILQRLNMEQGVFRAQIDDWRAVVDCIMIDTAYDGEVFNVALSDIPARKQDLVEGHYELPAPPKGSTVAVKVIDMLGEEVIVTQAV